jgi:hypothetical protein
MITTGKRYTPKEIERYVDAVTPEEIQRVAQKYLWDKDVSDSGIWIMDHADDSSLWLLLDEPRVSSTTTESERVSATTDMWLSSADNLDMSSMIY